MSDFRFDAERIIARVQKGEHFVLTRDGKPVAMLKPFTDEVTADDPFYALADLAQPGDSLRSADIDQTVYGG
jgi:antitoxin (DNA-binding transcriptional repressor) of toxin-antitoxin stability system